MELLDLITILEGSGLKRKTVNSKKGIEMTSYEAENNNTSIQINEDTHNNLIQTCLKHDNTNIYLYVNNTLRRNITKYPISSIETLVIT